MDNSSHKWTMATLEFWYRMMEHNPETSLAGNNYDIHRPEDWQVAPHTLSWGHENEPETIGHLLSGNGVVVTRDSRVALPEKEKTILSNIKEEQGNDKPGVKHPLQKPSLGRVTGPASWTEAPDGGWGWMCVLGLAINLMMFAALVRSFGITYLQLLERFHATPAETAWVGALNMACSGLFGPVATGLSSRYTPRLVTIVGGLLTFVGVLLTAFAPNIYMCYATYGLLAGFGSCLTFAPGYIVLGDYFEKRKATAMAVACVGSGVGALVAPPLLMYLFKEFGFQGAFVLLAACCLNSCIGGALYRPLKSHPTDKRPGQLFQWSLFLKPAYLGYFTLMLGLMLTAALTSAYLPALGIEMGLSELEATALLSMMGVADIVGTLAFGVLLDIPQVRRYRMYWMSFSNFVVALTTFCSPVLTNYAGFVATVVVRGVFMTHIISQRATLVADVVDRRWIPSGIGMLLCANALGALLGRSLGGVVTDAFGSYKAGFYMVGATNAVCAVFCVITYACTQKERREAALAKVTMVMKQDHALS